uniref:Uncharacterized protein n=2 Tax=Lepeophtheirus salmonis TaxID=72036 RepID=A0A0K2UQM7_LEPSM
MEINTIPPPSQASTWANVTQFSNKSSLLLRSIHEHKHSWLLFILIYIYFPQE